MKAFRALVFAAGLLASSGVSYAQISAVAPGINRVRLTFSGVVTNDVTDTIMIRQPQTGALVPYTGPRPDYPYKKGDALTISFTADVPNRNFTGPAGSFTGQSSVDGIFRFDLRPRVAGQSAPFGVVDRTEVNAGPITASPNAAGPSIQGLTIIYDANADSYSLDVAAGGWRAGNFSTPFYQFDQATNSLSSRSGCVEVSQLDCSLNSLQFRGDATSASYGETGTANPGIPIVNGRTDTPIGFLSGLLFAGSFNLPIFGNTGSTSVPEPGMTLLFAGGVAALVRRRRKAKVA